MFRMLLINTVLAILVTSCGGTFSYKRGAGPQALYTAQSSCEAIAKDDKKAMEECLEAQGWSVYQFDDMDLFAEASESTEANGGREIDSAFVTVDKPQKIEAAPVETAPIAPAPPSEKTTKVEPITEKTTSPQKAVATKTSKPKPSPYKTYRVSSWWQWGAGQQALERDLTACESSLGEKHKPDFSKQLVTRGFVVCMYKKGWKALKSK